MPTATYRPLWSGDAGAAAINPRHIRGKKNIRVDEPVERMDSKILEAPIAPNDRQMLLSGLRIDAFIMP